MRKLCSVILTAVLCLALILPASAETEDFYPAASTNNAIVVSSSTVEPDAHLVHPAVYKIEGYNYFKLRDLAMLLNGSGRQFAVDYDDAGKTVSITTGRPYQAVGGELSSPAEGCVSAIISNNAVLIDGDPVSFAVFKIGGENYFKLRDLGKALDFFVGYDDALKIVYISGAKGYIEEEKTDPGSGGTA